MHVSGAESNVKYIVKTYSTLPANTNPNAIQFYNHKMYVTGSTNNIYAVSNNGSYTIVNPISTLDAPTGIHIVDDWLYVSNSGSQKVSKMYLNDSPIQVFDVLTFYPNTNLFVLSESELYAVDKNNNLIRHWKDSSFALVSVGSLNGPNGIFIRNNTIYFTENGARTLKAIDQNNQISILASDINAYSVYVTEDNVIFFTDYVGSLIWRIKDGQSSVIAGYSGSSGNDNKENVNATSSSVTLPTGITFDNLTGIIYFAEISNQRIRGLIPYCETAGHYLNAQKSRCVSSVCSGVDSTNSSVCSSRGICNQTNQCSCQSKYFGDNCELTSCNGIQSNSNLVCSGNGTCQDYNFCNCKNGLLGKNCQIATCFGILSNQTSACSSGRGICQGMDFCNCSKGFVGQDCAEHTCGGISYNNTATCSGNGTCVGVDSCSCKEGFYGDNCQMPKCFSIMSNDTSVCSGNGECIGKDKCNCKSDYSGYRCEITSCFGIPSNYSNVCSGNGNCTFKDFCNCTFGYLGKQCEVAPCYGIPANYSNVCSGNGNCNGKDNCNCQPGFSGNQCEIPTCFGILGNSSMACSGNGECQNLDQCNCNSNYTGSKCDVPICFGIAKSSSLVCSAIGNCTKPDFCECPSNYEGYECQFRITPRKLQTNGIPTAIVQGISTTFDLKVIGMELRTFSDLVNSRKDCGVTCSLSLSYSWYLKDRDNGSPLIIQHSNTAFGNTKYLSSSTFQLTFSPVISIGFTRILSRNVTLTFEIVSGGENVSISQDILIISPLLRTKGLGKIQPSSGIALGSLFSIEEDKNLWTVSEESKKYLEPFQFAFGFFYNQELVRISDFSINGMDLLFLPYLNANNSNGQSENLDIYVICKDALKNEYSSLIGTVSISPNLVNTVEELKNQIDDIARIIPYDSSWKFRDLKEYSSVIIESVSKLSIDINNPSNTLTTLRQLTSQSVASSYQVGSIINDKIDSYLSSLNQVYKKEKETNGYVSNRLTNSDLKNTLSSASNLLFFGFSNISSLCTQLSSVLLYQQSTKIVSNSIDYSKYSTELINITVSSFVKSNSSIKALQFSDIFLDSDYILNKYNGYNKEIGLSLISYNSKLYNSSQTQITNSKDFTLYMGGEALPLSELVQPIYISFSVQNLTSLNQSLVKCQFWNETTEKWDNQGCSLHVFNQATGEVTCKCTHTTLFAAFVEQSFNETLVDQVVLKELSNLYIAQISFGVLFLMLSSTLLVGLIIMRKSQPLASRFVTPFIGMIALIVECILLLITQRSILLSEQNGWSESTAIQVESSDLAANIVSNIIAIIVNTLTLTAMFAYLYQISRYHILKYFYHKLSIKFSLNSGQKESERNLSLIRQLLSTKAMITIITTFVILNLLYWTLWVILVRTSAITGVAYSYIVSISFTVILLCLGFMICGLIGLDVFMTLMNERKEKSIVNNGNQENASQSSNSLQKFDKEATKKIAKISLWKAYNWFIKIDNPLYFRGEMSLFVLCFVFLNISQIIGISGLSYKKGEKMSRVNDSISLVFEVLYLFTYLLVFGGYALLVRLVQFIQQKKKQSLSKNRDSSEMDELSQILNNVEGLRLLEQFSEKEYSLENLHLFLEMKHNQQLIKTSDNMDELYVFMDNVWSTYIQTDSIKEVNIPSDCKRNFSKVKNSLFEIVKQQEPELKNQKPIPEELATELQQVFSVLSDQITFNLSDTFSRFSLTDEYSNYLNVLETQQELLNKSKLV
ncbi:predicted protein [Naegleria gruberi]|uniref:Predicted protein n=1 Tax=Naegleria gruberi TaxID=5762 RepID=D2V6B6_NAEGR|nr:uncharacterized protein NAEGRDRAFT_47020 [Naegleria gruberi]EFC47419.1 predicted protein [Naegleria gruberi]|eukprot:XP_002680163.1 predicted protein [Naegleria gruberi strain NEG-M]